MPPRTVTTYWRPYEWKMAQITIKPVEGPFDYQLSNVRICTFLYSRDHIPSLSALINDLWFDLLCQYCDIPSCYSRYNCSYHRSQHLSNNVYVRCTMESPARIHNQVARIRTAWVKSKLQLGGMQKKTSPEQVNTDAVTSTSAKPGWSGQHWIALSSTHSTHSTHSKFPIYPEL